MIGRTLGHYLIREHIGGGGMGDVYRARDLRLERDVAVKVLKPEAVGDDEARARLRREALALSRLNHPHIATVFDFDTSDESDFIVMELLEGETLAGRLACGPMSVAEAIRIGCQVADALAAAHAAGIVHRDLKPGNLILTPRGDVKVVDFGLAKRLPVGQEASASTLTMLTGPQEILGTLPYMAPEQLSGGTVDARTDLYALGAVLYEMTTGRPPFMESSPMALAGKILNSPSPPPRQLRRGLSAEIEGIIRRCLEKSPERRFPSARELKRSLDPTIQPGLGMVLRRLATPAAILLLAAAIAGLLIDVGGVRTRLLPARSQTLAVLPLQNLSGDPDQEYFAEGLAEELISTLAAIGALRVISRESAMSYRSTSKRLPEIARELRVENVVLGSVQRVADRVRIRLRLVKGATEQQLWTRTFDSNMADLLTMQSDVAQAVAIELRALVTPRERERLRSVRPTSAAALEAYLRGRYLYHRSDQESFRTALSFFQRAIREDPAYAPAYVGMADTYCGLSSSVLPAHEAMPKARAAAMKALEIDSTFAEAHASLAYVTALYDWNWRRAEASFQRAIALKPSSATTHLFYGMLLTTERRFDEATRELEIAWSLDPLSGYINRVRLWPLNYGRRDDKAIAMARAQIAADTSTFGARLVLGQALLRRRAYPEALAELKEARRLQPNPFIDAWIATGYAMAGKRDSAEMIRRTIEEAARQSFVQGYALAVLYAGLGEKDLAVEWLRKGVEQRSEELMFINADPAMDPLRADPRFIAIVRKIGLVPWPGS